MIVMFVAVILLAMIMMISSMNKLILFCQLWQYQQWQWNKTLGTRPKRAAATSSWPGSSLHIFRMRKRMMRVVILLKASWSDKRSMWSFSFDFLKAKKKPYFLVKRFNLNPTLLVKEVSPFCVVVLVIPQMVLCVLFCFIFRYVDVWGILCSFDASDSERAIKIVKVQKMSESGLFCGEFVPISHPLLATIHPHCPPNIQLNTRKCASNICQSVNLLPGLGAVACHGQGGGGGGGGGGDGQGGGGRDY